MNLYVKRLERGHFIWPQADAGCIHLSAAQLSMLLEGIDWRRPERTWKPACAA
jgi:transposase